MVVKLRWLGYLWSADPETAVSLLWWEFKVMFYTTGSCFNFSGAGRNASWQPLILDFIISTSGSLALTPAVPGEVSVRDSSGLFFITQLLLFHFFSLYSVTTALTVIHYQSSKLVQAFSRAPKKNEDFRGKWHQAAFGVSVLGLSLSMTMRCFLVGQTKWQYPDLFADLW